MRGREVRRPDMAVCCPPLADRPLSAEDAVELASILKALSDPVRLRLLSMIASHRSGEACVCDLSETFDLSGPTISYHLKVLRLAGLVETERRRTWVYYRVRPSVLTGLAQVLGAAGGPAVVPRARVGDDPDPDVTDDRAAADADPRLLAR